jgi:hypothetical protein
MHRRSLVVFFVAASTLAWSGGSVAAEPDVNAAAVCEAASVSAQRLKLAHGLVQARKDLLKCSAPECPTVIRRDCDRWLTEVDAILPTIVPGAQDAHGKDLSDVRVDVDGVNVASRIEGAAVPIDPGQHLVRFTRGTSVVDQQIVVREGERGRPVVVRFPPLPGEEPPPPPPPPEPSKWLTIGTYAFAGLSIVGLGVGTVETIRGVSEYRDLRDSCGATRTCAPDAVESARRDILIADVAFTVGVISAAAAVVLYLAQRDTAARAPVLTGALR